MCAGFCHQPQGARRHSGRGSLPCPQIPSPHPASSRDCFAGTFQRPTKTNLSSELDRLALLQDLPTHEPEVPQPNQDRPMPNGVHRKRKQVQHGLGEEGAPTPSSKQKIMERNVKAHMGLSVG